MAITTPTTYNLGLTIKLSKTFDVEFAKCIDMN